jgi:hypothetical protein
MLKLKEVSATDKAIIVDKYKNGVSMDSLHKEYDCTRYIIRKIITTNGGYIRERGRPTLGGASPILREKLILLAEILGKPVNKDVLKTIVDYALWHNDGRTFRKIDRRYNYNGALSAFRRDHLEVSYYVRGCLWRYMYQAVVAKRTDFTDYGIAGEDARLCMSVLTDADRTRITEWVANAGVYVRLPNEEGVHKVVQDCTKTINQIVGKKLRFIYQYDPAFEREDLVSSLLVIAYRVAIKYDWEMLNGAFDYLKCLNYTKRSLWNEATAIIKANTGEDYKRLEQINSSDREYQVTTISLDTPLEDEWLSIENKLGESPDTSLEVKDLISTITDQRLHDFLNLEHEDVPAFTAFVAKETGEEENDLYNSDYSRWREMAQKFSDILTREDRGQIKRSVTLGMGTFDKSKAKRLRTSQEETAE